MIAQEEKGIFQKFRSSRILDFNEYKTGQRKEYNFGLSLAKGDEEQKNSKKRKYSEYQAQCSLEKSQEHPGLRNTKEESKAKEIPNQYLMQYKIEFPKNLHYQDYFSKKRSCLQQMLLNDAIMSVDELFDLESLRLVFGTNVVKRNKDENAEQNNGIEMQRMKKTYDFSNTNTTLDEIVSTNSTDPQEARFEDSTKYNSEKNISITYFKPQEFKNANQMILHPHSHNSQINEIYKTPQIKQDLQKSDKKYPSNFLNERMIPVNNRHPSIKNNQKKNLKGKVSFRENQQILNNQENLQRSPPLQNLHQVDLLHNNRFVQEQQVRNFNNKDWNGYNSNLLTTNPVTNLENYTLQEGNSNKSPCQNEDNFPYHIQIIQPISYENRNLGNLIPPTNKTHNCPIQIMSQKNVGQYYPVHYYPNPRDIMAPTNHQQYVNIEDQTFHSHLMQRQNQIYPNDLTLNSFHYRN